MSAKYGGDVIMSQPAFLLCVIVAFGAVSFDVFGENSGHYLQAVDEGKGAVCSKTDPGVVWGDYDQDLEHLRCQESGAEFKYQAID